MSHKITKDQAQQLWTQGSYSTKSKTITLENLCAEKAKDKRVDLKEVVKCAQKCEDLFLAAKRTTWTETKHSLKQTNADLLKRASYLEKAKREQVGDSFNAPKLKKNIDKSYKQATETLRDTHLDELGWKQKGIESLIEHVKADANTNQMKWKEYVLSENLFRDKVEKAFKKTTTATKSSSSSEKKLKDKIEQLKKENKELKKKYPI